MEELTILNWRTVKNKSKRYGKMALLLGGLYAAYVATSSFGKVYSGWRATSRLENIIEELKYSEARQMLLEMDDQSLIKEERKSELEAKIESINPDSLFVKAQSTELPQKVKLLEAAYYGQKSLGYERQDIKEQYVDAYLLNVAMLLEGYKGDKVKEALEILHDNQDIIKRNGTLYSDVHMNSITLDKVFTAEVNYLRTLDTYHLREDGSKIVISSLEIARALSSNRYMSHVKNVLEVFGEEIKLKVLPDPKFYDSTKLELVVLLKRLEDNYGYKVLGFDVDKAILELASKNN